MDAVLVGYGEVGKGLFQAFEPFHEIRVEDTNLLLSAGEEPTEVLLVAIPYSDSFLQSVMDYQIRFRPAVTIVFSSVPIGTTGQLKDAVHSPIEGRHDNMSDSIQKWPRWIGGYNRDAVKFFVEAHLDVKILQSPSQTEFLKLRSTTVYGINIEMARWSERCSHSLDLGYSIVKAYDRDYNHLVSDTLSADFQRSVLDPPKGKIGGHCVLPNAKLIRQGFDHPFIETLLELNGEK